MECIHSASARTVHSTSINALFKREQKICIEYITVKIEPNRYTGKLRERKKDSQHKWKHYYRILLVPLKRKKTSTDSFNNFDPVDELYLSLESLALIGILYVFSRQSVHEKREKNRILNRFDINSSCCILSCLKFFNIIFKVLILFDIFFSSIAVH